MKTTELYDCIDRLDKELKKLEISESDIIDYSVNAFGICKIAILNIKEIVQKKGFENIEEEIEFFKNIKPNVFSRLIFYSEVHRIETHRPKSNKKFQIKFLKREFRKFRQYLEKNLEFYQYYKGGQTCCDKIYFVRNQNASIVSPKNYGYIHDPKFCTSHDDLVSHILTYEKLEKYIDNEIIKLKKARNTPQNDKLGYNNLGIIWTAPKASLVELIYALHSSSCINNGRIDVKELVTLFETVFDIKLNSSYRIFIDIKGRQKTKAKFLEELKKALLNRLNDLDALRH